MIIRPLSKKISPGKKGLLILDNYYSHHGTSMKDNSNELLLNSFNFDALYLPPNYTDKLQPLDISVNKQFKYYYNEYIDEFLGKTYNLLN